MKDELFKTATLEAERVGLQEEMAVAAELMQKCIEENARVALNQAEYQARYDGLVLRYDTAKARFEQVSELVADKKARGKLVEAFAAELARQDRLVTEFDERLWFSLVDFATVYGENDVWFTFKDGTEINSNP